MTKRVAVLLSGRGSNFQSLLNASLEGSLGGEISLVISNRPGAGGPVLRRMRVLKRR